MFGSKALTASQLRDIFEGASHDITVTSSMGFESTTTVVDYDVITERLSELASVEPDTLFADLIGMTRAEAQEYVNTRCNGDGGKNKSRTTLPLVSTITVFFEDGKETSALFERTNALRGTSGMLTGKGMGREYDLVVSITEDKVSEIIHYGE